MHNRLFLHRSGCKPTSCPIVRASLYKQVLTMHAVAVPNELPQFRFLRIWQQEKVERNGQ
jgi:hypothetical protein